ncbi:MAG: UDP-N-acetylmuramate dehydrogenase [Clostridia bacterium]|nr:UDP-N-acetylmuramate dehydrogenase [Clostridia bacterium]
MNYQNALTRLTDVKIEYSENTLLAPHTSFRIGGAARLAVFPSSCDEAVKVFDILREENIPTLVLGNGTNVLVSDDGYDGAAVILTGMRACSVSGKSITAEAGVPLTRLAGYAAKNSLAGLEFAYGIPGTLGGGIYMNAGAYGGDMSQVVTSSRYYDLASGECGTASGAAHEFAYRHSVYMDSTKVILSAALTLTHGERDEIEAKMNDYMSRRREKQPLEYPSAGSTFKRGNGFITSQIIDEVGLKGRRVGGAEVSEKHAGFVINRGGATAKDVLELIEIIKDEVKNKTGYDIECEVRYIGN